jgi:CBS domain containing-hemolysin-like protein
MPDTPPVKTEDPVSTDRRTGADGTILQRLRSLFGSRQSSSDLRESLAGALDEVAGIATDPFSAKERSMLRNVLGLRDLRVDDVMVPRADIDAVDVNVTIAGLLEEFREAGHSRLPVYRETLDEPAGMVHIKDLLGWMTSQALLSEEDLARRRTKPPGNLDLRRVPLNTALSNASIIRPVLYVPPSMPAVDLLVKMQATRVHLAIVVDEYGGTDGLVSIEDLVEEIVGEIEDEHDEETAPMIVPTDDGGFIADARAPLEEVAKMLGESLEIGDLVEDIDTLGGLVFNQVGHVPVRGELVEFPGGFEFEILDADPRRVKRVRIHRRAAGAPRGARRERAEPATTEPARSGTGRNA